MFANIYQHFLKIISYILWGLMKYTFDTELNWLIA